MDEGGAMLWGRVTYEMMESYWPAVARGDELKELGGVGLVLGLLEVGTGDRAGCS